MPDYYTFGNFKRAIQNPSLFLYESRRIAGSPFHSMYNQYINKKSENGIDVMSEDWDNLIILDACRYDYFASQNSLDGKLEEVTSRGKRSWEFMEGNFVGREFHDTVYVTANPHTSKLDDDLFHSVELLLNRWDDEIGTVQPEEVVSAAVEAHESYPNKKLIIHFMQPHRPYIGPTAEKLRERVDLVGFDNSSDGVQIWGAAKQGDITVSEVRKAYSESLEGVLDHVETLLDNINGKSVVTSDHGEMLGERIFPFANRLWGHSEGIATHTLLKVPWLIIDSDKRRETYQETPSTNMEFEEDVIQDRLQALGYKT
ncbi:sulfatase-like hydrolase/transferase [Halostagnicola kamekurae]|uniref:Sulfatase N-terminal domain-containing protein n=1 Tax=Halostagnicola kamekurae TaxID=619731 RepID=A0A1I6RVF3_9EURY|nr:sulfatase-like hydrolase/transferase [Halostagnicola kamekurae]SFS68448.1 hypothetical protein SAMN04488556_2160 [Halostagnicola kamekurae]